MAPRRAPVVVAVGSGEVSDDAVEWAAAEAAAQRRPLRIVSVLRPPLLIDPFGSLPLTAGPLAAEACGEAVVQAALRVATSVASDLAVSTALLGGPTGSPLWQVSRNAALLVLSRPGRVRRLLGGAGAGRIAARACCPVVVIGRPAQPSRSRGAPRVVVGVDVPPRCPEALDLAFRAAAQRAVPLVAVHACAGGAPAHQQLERLLSPWRNAFPYVPVQVRLPVTAPVTALVEESRSASLLVVGCRGGGRLRTAVLGGVSRSLLDRAQVPLAVVRPARSGATRSADRAASAFRADADAWPLPGASAPWEW
jgi:nucleotide-binding universal stress UspA family protein